MNYLAIPLNTSTVAINRKTFLNNLRGKDFNYSDNFYKLKGRKIIPNNSFSYWLYDVMTDVVDFKTNNCSNIFLSKNGLTSNWLLSSTPSDTFNDEESLSATSESSTTDSSIVMLAFSPFKNDSDKSLHVKSLKYNLFPKYSKSNITSVTNVEETVDNTYLFFQLNANNSQEVPNTLSVRHHPFTLGEDNITEDQFQISLTFLNSDTCTITHEYGGTTYYLAFAYTNSWSTSSQKWKYAQISNGQWNTTYSDITLLWTNDIQQYPNHIWNFKENSDGGYEFFVQIEEKNTKTSYYLARGFSSPENISITVDGKEYTQYIADDDTVILSPKIAYKEAEQATKTSGGLYIIEELAQENYIPDYVKDSIYESATVVYLKSSNLNTYKNIQNSINQSFVGYNRANIIGEINSEISFFDIPSQYVLHHEYNNENGINFIPLKNTMSYQGNTILGHYDGNMIFDDNNPVSFREYVSLNTGFNQEKGTGNMNLSYTFSDQEYEVNDGEDIIIDTTPLELPEGTSIPIQNTAFIKNGVFGSDVPWFADKFKMMQNDRAGVDNGLYLCTWLFKKNMEDDNPQWLDRYYNPATMQVDTALKERPEIIRYEDAEGFDEAVCLLRNVGVADFPSAVKIKPNTKYKFSRLSKEMVCESISNFGDSFINVVKNQSDKKVNLFDEIRLNGEEYRKIEMSNNDNINSFNFNTDIFIDPDKKMGLSLLGTSNNQGFSISNRTDISPYFYYSDNDNVYLLNNKWEVAASVSLKDLFQDTVLKVIQGQVFDDILVVSPLYLYVFTYNLHLKTRISLVPNKSQEDELAIFNLSEDGLFKNLNDRFGKQIRLMNYPYGNYSKDLSLEQQENSAKISLRTEKSIPLSHTPHSISKTIFVDFGTRKQMIPSNISEIFARSNSVWYNHNLYIPYKTEVIKIIFCPDKKEDSKVFTEEVRKEYPAAARILNKNEYHMNFFWDDRDETSVKEINSVYIDGNGNIYALNFDQVCMSYDKETLICAFSKDKSELTNSDEMFTIYTEYLPRLAFEPSKEEIQDNVLFEQAIQRKEPQPLFVSFKSFEKIISNGDGYIAMITNGKEKKELIILDRFKEIKLRKEISPFEEIISLDSINFIDSDGNEKHNFVLFSTMYSSVYRTDYECFTGESKTAVMNTISPNHSLFFSGFSNNDALTRGISKNTIYFTINLPSQFIFNHRITIPVSIENFVKGWYNINVSVDLNDASFIIRLNDHIFKSVYWSDEEENEGNVYSYDFLSQVKTKNVTEDYWFFTPHSFVSHNTFNHTYFLGVPAEGNGFSLNTSLKNNALADPYTATNTTLNNTTFVTKALSLSEYQSLRLRGKEINRIVLTLPCNRRNAIEEMSRFFKYSGGGAISNNIKVIVDGHGIADESVLRELSSEIYETLDGNIDAITRVNNIDFIR